MEKKAVFQLVMLLLGLSYLMSSDARVLISRNLDPAGVQMVDMMMSNRKMLMVESTKEHKEVKLNDYPGSGANDRHDPKIPGES
ncbi:hypothetical protein MRB53_008343 [Persea americana]|uniref:Uncharacterized protein n=1 Tax=Persea americana TaxID=3435 RepID=A0ACC2MMG9_PERAE|nr:hypothetical protein MRB53_008343 [Persea americana]